MSINYDSETDSSRDDVLEHLEAKSTSLMYKVEWRDELSKARRNFQSKDPFTPLEVATENVDIQESTYHVKDGKPAIEVITPVLGRALLGGRDPEVEDSSVRKPKGNVPAKFEDISITKVRPTRLTIHSQELINLIHQCVEYYPEITFTGDRVVIYEPYCVLVHHIDKLRNLQARFDTDGESPESSSKEVRNHLASLLKYLDEYMKLLIIPAIKKLEQPLPTVSFDNLWLLFKPGLDVYRFFSYDHLSHIPFAAVVMESYVPVLTDEEYKQEKKDTFYLRSWVLESDGQLLSREKEGHPIDQYEGERQVTSLPTYPCKYYDSEDGGERRKRLIDRGRKVYAILRQMPKAAWYDGHPYAKKRQMVRKRLDDLILAKFFLNSTEVTA